MNTQATDKKQGYQYCNKCRFQFPSDGRFCSECGHDNKPIKQPDSPTKQSVNKNVMPQSVDMKQYFRQFGYIQTSPFCLFHYGKGDNYDLFGNNYPGRKIIYIHKGFSHEADNIEAIYQGCKYSFNPQIAKLFNNITGKEAVLLKHKYSNIDQDWDIIKFGIMKDLLRKKFADPEYKRVLIATGKQYIVNHTTIKGKDNIWSDDSDGSGQNNLGRLLMEVRGEIGGSGLVKRPNEYDQWLFNNKSPTFSSNFSMLKSSPGEFSSAKKISPRDDNTNRTSPKISPRNSSNIRTSPRIPAKTENNFRTSPKVPARNENRISRDDVFNKTSWRSNSPSRDESSTRISPRDISINKTSPRDDRTTLCIPDFVQTAKIYEIVPVPIHVPDNMCKACHSNHKSLPSEFCGKECAQSFFAKYGHF
jgi:predicted NAD-dependent protein-ADP-ribosyltransferase YbiA (DUF1768 family)